MVMKTMDRIINDFCYDVTEHSENRSWKLMSDNDIYLELFNCILGSQVKYEISITYAYKLVDSIDNLFNDISSTEVLENKIRDILVNPATHPAIGKQFKSYRFYNKGTERIMNAILLINSDRFSLRNIFHKNSYSVREIRRILINEFQGLGPKQASHFLKNISYSEKIAIIDSHILKYLRKKSGIQQIIPNKLNSIDYYELVENEFLEQVKNFDFPPVIVDQSIWFISRNGGF